MRRPFHSTMLLISILTATPTALFGQGALTPPAGAPAPVFKTLTEVEPRTPVQSLAGVAGQSVHQITKPGSYYLTGNVVGAFGLNGIRITTGGVTLDLNGYEIVGVPGSQSGIQCSAGKNHVIRNGVVRNWSSIGVDLVLNDVAENLIVDSNGYTGIDAGTSSIIRNCTIKNNGSTGILADAGCIVETCTISFNTASGIVANGAGGRVGQCVITSNQINGISQGTGTAWMIAGNTINSNVKSGISVNKANMILNNVLYANGAGGAGAEAAGIYLGGGANHVQGNHLVQNNYGIYASGQGKETVFCNTVINSTSSNYVGGGINNAGSFGPVNTTTVGVTNPTSNFSY